MWVYQKIRLAEKNSLMQGGTFKMPGQDGQANYQEGMRLYSEGRQSEAMPFLMAGLASMESIWGQEDRVEMVDCLQALGDCYENAMMLKEALTLRIRLFELGVKVLGPQHPDVIAIMLKICMLQEHLGFIPEAMTTIDDAVMRAKYAVTRQDPLAQRLIEQYNRLQLIQHKQQLPPDTGALPYTPALTDGPASMQDFARQMLADMPGFVDQSQTQSPSPSSKQGYNNYLSTSMSSMTAMDQSQVNDLRPAPSLDPNKTPSSLPKPPDESEMGQRQPQTRDSGALSYRPQNNEQDVNLSEESYSIDQIRQIRDRNRLSGDLANSDANGNQSKARRLSPDDQRSIRLGRIIKDFTLPVIGVGVVLALIGYLIFSNPADDLAKDEKEKAIQTALQSALGEDIFLTADGEGAIRFQGPAQAIYSPSAGSGATQVGFRRLNSAWGDIFGAAYSSIWEKQIWFDDNQSVLNSEDDVRYYRATGREFQTIQKMKQLAGIAQGFYLRGGQYPDAVPPALINYFSYLNPYTGSIDQFQIRQIPLVDALGLKAKENLESGRLLGGDDKGAPGKIVCYAVIEGEIKKTDSASPHNKCVAFMIRGYDSHGQLIQTSRPGQALVIEANPEYLDTSAVPADKKVTTVKTKTKIKIKTQVKSKALTPNPVRFEPVTLTRDPQNNTPAINAIKARPVVPSQKTTFLMLIKHPPLPLKVLHYLLSIGLFLCTALAIARSRMRAVDYLGNQIQEDSNVALIIGIIFAIMLGISLLMQFVIYA